MRQCLCQAYPLTKQQSGELLLPNLLSLPQSLKIQTAPWADAPQASPNVFPSFPHTGTCNPILKSTSQWNPTNRKFTSYAHS